MNLTQTLSVSASGMTAQSSRLQVISQNIANSATTGTTPGADPYRRKTIEFSDTLNQTLGADTVSVKKIGTDSSAFPLKYDPANPAADANGYIKTPNVNSFVEIMDMKEAQRSYTANLNVMETTRGMLSRTIDLLR